jgi:hypothetical protein
VHDHLIDDDLGEERGCQAHELYGQRGRQSVAPELFVFQQLGDEPAKTEFPGLFSHIRFVGAGARACRSRHKEHLGRQAGVGLVHRERFRRLPAWPEVEQGIVAGLDNDYGLKAGWGGRFCRLFHRVKLKT